MAQKPDALENRTELTTPLGLFNFAASYRAAADKLRVCKLRATHPHSPILFTYYHSIELYLKAFLRAQGHTLARLQDIGHGYDTLHRLSADCGLPFRDEDTDVLNVLARPGAWSATRYLEVGYNIRPTLSALSRTCKSLDRSVGDALIARGIRIRRMTRGVRVTN